jgi:uncharacterized damage-inducible protein DinB
MTCPCHLTPSHLLPPRRLLHHLTPSHFHHPGAYYMLVRSIGVGPGAAIGVMCVQTNKQTNKHTNHPPTLSPNP